MHWTQTTISSTICSQGLWQQWYIYMGQGGFEQTFVGRNCLVLSSKLNGQLNVARRNGTDTRQHTLDYAVQITMSMALPIWHGQFEQAKRIKNCHKVGHRDYYPHTCGKDEAPRGQT